MRIKSIDFCNPQYGFYVKWDRSLILHFMDLFFRKTIFRRFRRKKCWKFFGIKFVKYDLTKNVLGEIRVIFHSSNSCTWYLQYVNRYLLWLHTTQCGNQWRKIIFSLTVWKLRKFTLTLFGKNFVKATHLLKKLLKSLFDEIFLCWERNYHFSTLCGGLFLSKQKIPWKQLVC